MSTSFSLNNIQAVKDHYAPVFIQNKAKKPILDIERTAIKIAEWSQEFFGDPKLEEFNHYHVRTNVPEFHKDIYVDLMSFYRLYYITAPSEFAKTTVCALFYPLYQQVYFKEPHTVLTGRVDDISVGMLDSIKFEIEDNEKFRQVYGDLKGEPAKDGRRWSDHAAETTIGTLLRAVPINGNLRGRKRGNWRITLHILDDVEELVDLKSPSKLKENWNWIMRTAEKRMDKAHGKLRLCGNYIGPNCCIERAISDTRFKGRKYKALLKTDDGVEYSIWEEWFPTSFLIKERKDAIANNALEAWMYERQNEKMASLDKKIPYKIHKLAYRRINGQNVLVDTEDSGNMFDPIPVNIYAAIDPAFAMTKNADPRAGIVFAMGRMLVSSEHYPEPFLMNCMWSLELLYNRMEPDLLINWLFDMHKKYYLSGATVEAISGAQIYEHIAFRKMMPDPFFAANPLSINWEKWQPAGKLDRIYARLQPLGKNGQFHILESHYELMEECDTMDEDEVHILDALELGVKNAKPSSEEYKSSSKESRDLARVSTENLRRRLAIESGIQKPLNQTTHGTRLNLRNIL